MRKALALIGALLGLVLTGCAPQPEPLDPLPRIEDYVPSDADLERYQSIMDAMAQSYGLGPQPKYEIVRWVNIDEFNEAYFGCLESLGFDVSRVGDSDGVNYTVDQEQIVREAMYRCTAEYPVRQDIYRPWNEAEVRIMYAHLRDEYIPCVTALGYPGLELPSLQTYLDSEGAAFDPLAELYELYPGIDFVAVDENCPRAPDGFRKPPK